MIHSTSMKIIKSGLLLLTACLLLPGFSRAAEKIDLKYDAATGTFSGDIYTNHATIAVGIDANGTPIPADGITQTSSQLSQNGFFRIHLDGNLGTGQSISSISVNDGTVRTLTSPSVSESVYGFLYDATPQPVQNIQIGAGSSDSEVLSQYLTVSWAASTDFDIDHYEIYLDDVLQGTKSQDNHDFQSYIISGLTKGQKYKVGVAAVDLAGNTSMKSIVDAYFPGDFKDAVMPIDGMRAKHKLPPHTSIVSFSPTIDVPANSKFQITFPLGTNGREAGESDFLLVGKNSGVIHISAVQSTPANQYFSFIYQFTIDGALDHNDVYTLQVVPDGLITLPDDKNSSYGYIYLSHPSALGWIDSKRFQLNFMSVKTPTGLTATARNGQVALSWNANMEPYLAGYRIYQGDNVTPLNSSLITDNSFTVGGLTNGTEYAFRISAVDDLGVESILSSAVNATAQAPPPSPPIVVVPPSAPIVGIPPSAPIVVVSPSAPATFPVYTGDGGEPLVEVKSGDQQLTIPIFGKIKNGQGLEVNSEQFDIQLPAKVIDELQKLAGSDQNANLKLEFNKVDPEEADRLMVQGIHESGAIIRTAGSMYEFNLSVTTQSGETKSLTKFDQPLTLKFKFNRSANPDLLGVYYVADDGKLEYVGGTVNGDHLETKINHFSKYVALEYQSNFDDVADDYWAGKAIKKLVAKHIIEGTSARNFSSNAPITRAEFASFLARTLDLSPDAGSLPFTDVSDSEWYSSAVKAVYKTGIISGRTGTKFSPNDNVTREEMAVMLMKAYELKSGMKIQQTVGGVGFFDRKNIQSWAKPYVDAAVALKFLSGRSSGLFQPSEFTTRAEAALVISMLNDVK